MLHQDQFKHDLQARITSLFEYVRRQMHLYEQTHSLESIPYFEVIDTKHLQNNPRLTRFNP